MSRLPPPLRDQRKVDADHLRVLGIFHLVVAGLAVVGIVFVLLHFAIMNVVFGNSEMWNSPGNSGPTPDQFFPLFMLVYGFMGLILVVGGVVNLLSGVFILRRKHRLFSLVVAGMNCIQIPIGTVLGVATIMVLLRENVQELYASR